MKNTVSVKQYRLFIDGEWVDSDSGEWIESINPLTLDVVAQFPRGNKVDINRAVSAAKRAYESEVWQDMLPAERGRLLLKMAELVRSHKEELIQIERSDTGQPRWLVEGGIGLCARYFEYYGGVADKIQGESIPLRSDFIDYTIREPLGVTAHIVPWNYPLQILSRSIAPALAAGNAVVIKPAEDTSLSALKIAELLNEAGFPKGIINVVTGYGSEVGDALASHPDIDHITFTGSTNTGTHIMKRAADNIASVTLELGGKSPQIVFADADLDETAQVVVRSITQNAGQTCVAGSRLVVEESIYAEFVDRISKRMDELTYPDDSAENYEISPIISEKQIQRVEEYMKIAKEEGCSILRGGKELPKEHYYLNQQSLTVYLRIAA